MRCSKYWSVLTALPFTAALLASYPVFADDEAGSRMTFGGAGWMGLGAIVKTTDTLNGMDIAGKPMYSTGAQVLLGKRIGENLDIEAGVGVGGRHAISQGDVTLEGGYSPFGYGPYVAQANFTYNWIREEERAFFLRGGLFAYDYAKENQNLGLYLLRGPVYPGFVLSGFETKHVLPVANTMGAQLRYASGMLTHDLILQFETEFYPFYDISPAYIINARFGSGFRLGAGVNFHHLIPVDPSLTTDTTSMVWVDTSTTPHDSIQLSARGVKLMVNATLDLKSIFGGVDALGPEDLKIYGEAALIGLRNDKAAKYHYGEFANRIPKMIGINLPTFKLLDRLALEVEHYTAPFADNLEMFRPVEANRPTVMPADPDSVISRDDIKWSLYGSKVIHEHIKISLQVASDHFRPGIFTGYGDNNPPLTDAVLFRPQDWYWMGKIAYFF